MSEKASDRIGRYINEKAQREGTPSDAQLKTESPQAVKNTIGCP